MGSGEVAIVALSTMISLKVTFSDGLGGNCIYTLCVLKELLITRLSVFGKKTFIRFPMNLIFQKGLLCQ